MRTLLFASLAALALCAACGQKGPLVLPRKSVATPVVIRPPDATADGGSAAPSPATPAATATPATPAAAAPPPPEQKKDEPPPSPPRR
jgi:predicted small lipoprotein YifL